MTRNFEKKTFCYNKKLLKILKKGAKISIFSQYNENNN
jgi:hypothetical protein